MPWQRVEMLVDEQAVEGLSDALMAAGAVSVDVQDAAAGTPQEHALFGEPGAVPAGSWHSNRLSALFDTAADLSTLIPGALAAAGLAADHTYTVEKLEDADWVRLTQSQFLPIQISKRLWIVPSWHKPPDPCAINIQLDPGVAFGTGAHPTTRLCLRWLETVVTPGSEVLDYGCGSGILAIAAMKLGAGRVQGVDIDPQALVAARANALQNQASCAFMDAESSAVAPADVVVANILANPLRVLAPLLARLTRSGGELALAGILEDQAEEVMSVYEPYFVMRVAVADEGWSLLSGTRR